MELVFLYPQGLLGAGILTGSRRLKLIMTPLVVSVVMLCYHVEGFVVMHHPRGFQLT